LRAAGSLAGTRLYGTVTLWAGDFAPLLGLARALKRQYGGNKNRVIPRGAASRRGVMAFPKLRGPQSRSAGYSQSTIFVEAALCMEGAQGWAINHGGPSARAAVFSVRASVEECTAFC